MTSQKAPHVPGTPSLREKIAIRLEENGDSDVDGLDCVRTPSAPLHNTFDDLEKLWSSRKSSIRKDNVEDYQGISSSIKSEQTQSKQKSNQTAPRTGTLRKKKVASSVEIIGSPDLIFPTTPKEPALTQSIRSKNSSVFDRLYQKGKSKVATARLRELDTSTSSRVRGLASPSASSIGGTTVSTLSSADSNFERLFKGEKRKNRFAEEHHAASAVLERRLSYTNPGNKNRTRPTAPRTSTATDERSISTVSTTTSSVFDRLYTKDKRPTPSLTENANFRKSRIQSPRSRHKSNKSANNSLSETPIVRGSRRRENLGLDGDSVIESVADFSERWHNDEESLLLNTSAFNDYELIHQFHLLATEISSKQENTATFADLEYELFSDLNQYTPCQVFTASESNENEEGKRINEQRKEMDLPEVSIYSKIRLGVLIGEFNTNAAAMAIQKVWKGYRGRTELVNMLLLSWQIRLDYNASTTSNRISLMRIRLQSLSKAAEGVELTKHIVLQQVEKSAIHLEWKRPVLVHFQRQEIPRLESVVVVLTCGACRPLFIKNWSTSNMANLVVKLSLRRISQLERDSLMAFFALLIQCQARKMYAKKISAIARCRFIDTKISFQLQDISSTSLACCAATSIQNLWRSHRAQLDTSAALLRSWSIEFGFKSFITTNRILLAKVKICSLSKALGRVDYWWITERIKIGENDMEFNWQREIGVHFNEKGFPRLESCEINLKCLISRSSFAEKWGPRKLAILVVKASLEQVLRRDVAHLRACSASKIQNWFRRSTAKLDKTLDHELTSRIPRYALSTNGLRSIASHSLEPVRYTRPPCNPLISHEDCESATITIQSPSKLLLVNLQVDSHVVAATVIQSMFRYHLAGGLFRTKNSAANRMRKVSFEVNQKHVENLRRRNIVVVQSLWRRKTALSNFTNASKAIILIQVQIRRRQCKIRFAVVSSGIVLLQSQYRGVSCRTQFRKKKKALATFQSLWRAFLIRRSFITARAYSVMIQSHCRRYVICREYQIARVGVLNIQSHYRGHRSRKAISQRDTSVLLIQRNWRGHRDRLHYKVVLTNQAATVLQKVTRRALVRAEIHRFHRASLKIQCFWRRFQMSSTLSLRVSSVLIIQACTRGWKTRRAYALARRAIISFQSQFRCSNARHRLFCVRMAAIQIQTIVRAYLDRQKMAFTLMLAGKIQRRYRCHRDASRFVKLRFGLVLLQAMTRGAQWRGKLARRRYVAETVQRLWRGYKERLNHIVLMKVLKIEEGNREASNKIQSLVRSRRFLQFQTKLQKSANRIQSLWRMRNVRHAFLVLKMSATMIQSQVRRHQTCTMLASSRHTECAAISIQKAWRSCTARLEYRKFIISCLHLQARYRGVLLRRQLVVLHLGAQEIQRVWRGQKCRQNMETLRLQEESASTVIQSVVRRRFRRDLYLRNSAACAIQTRWRSYHVHDRFLLLQLCAVKIQTEYRRYCARKAYTKLALAVAVLQSIGRRYVHGTIYRRRIALRHMAATRIQSLWRLYPGRALNDATSLSQTEWLDTKLKDVSSRSQARLFFKLSCRQNDPGFSRKNDLGRSFVAAVLIQVQWRLYLQRMSTTRPRQELFIRGLQEPTRSWTVPDEIDNHWAAADRTDRKDFQSSLSSKSYCQLLTIASSEIAAISIQSACRRYLARKAYFQKFRLMHSAARRIQVGYLTWQMELILLNVQSSVVLLRRSVRGQLVRSATRFALDNLNTCFRASTSTSFGRIVAESCQNEALCSSWTHAVDMARESACVVIQSAVRRTLARNRSRFVYRLNDGSMLSPIITSLFSWSKQRSPKEFLHHDDTCLEVAMLKPITSLQSSPHDITVVMTTTNVSSRMMPEACANVLAVLNESECHDGASGTKISASTPSKCSDRIVLEHAATKIQSTYRGFRSRRRSFSYLPEIIKLQSFIRTQLSHTKFRSAQFNATQIQRYWKEYQRRLFVRKMHDAAITIQLVARAVARKRDFDTQRAAALSIQAHFRVSQDRLRRRSFNLKLSHAVISLQKLSRRAVAMAHFAKVKASITKVQARFRGMVVRVYFKRLSREKKSLDSERLRPIVEMLIMSDVIAHAHNSLDNLLNESSDFMGLPPPCVRRLTKRVNALPRAALLCTVHGRFETSSEHMSEVGLSCPKEASPTSCNSSTKLFLSRKDARSDRLDNSRLQEMRAQLIVPRLKALPTLIVKSPSAMEMKNSKEMANQSQNGAASKELARATQSLLNEARAALHGKPKTSSHDKLNAFPLGNPRSPPKGDDTFDSENFGDDKNEMPSPIKEPSIMETWDWADHLM